MKRGKPPEIPGNNQMLDGEINPEFYSKSYIQCCFIVVYHFSLILIFCWKLKKYAFYSYIRKVIAVRHFVTEVS